LLPGPFTGRDGRCPAPDVVRVDRRWRYRSVRKEPNKKRKVGLIGCRRRNLAVSICHSLARERHPRASLSPALSQFFLQPPPPPKRRRAWANPPPLTRNLSLDLAVTPVRLDVGRILREFSSLFEPPWNSIHVSGGRAKNPTTVADPLLAGAYVPSYVLLIPR